ncbi:PadR family transcriptional regulator [Rhodococcoides kyotonense]|uniref:Transcriptional regulator PadR-like family protein n=1 Tax=Rhodococcoides kyotonense TaxID=398843 RepID=A0A239MSR0_9NOCA|nr:PadR family transcriptional regulator [Rhodococcus kyotonensis]SNT45283.1 Transcriptional regulator PadR-like family protein [Rhodococcus kyotonensis]
MARDDLNTTSYVILGLLVSRDWSAYEIAEHFAKGIGELWPRADRQSYNAPKKLLDLGLVTSTNQAVGARNRTVYSITTEGRDALVSWLSTGSRPSALEFEGMIRVLVAEQGSIDDLRNNLLTMRDQAASSRSLFGIHANTIRETDGGTFPEREHLMALANNFMIGHFTHIVEWAEWALTEIEEWPDTVAPATSSHERNREILAKSAVYAPGTSTP